MKKYFSGYHLAKLVCLLLLAGILCLSQKTTALAVTDTPYRESNLTGTTEERTNERAPGASEDADELAELNIANTVTITYGNGNGSVNGALRILVILTLSACLVKCRTMMILVNEVIMTIRVGAMAINVRITRIRSAPFTLPLPLP